MTYTGQLILGTDKRNPLFTVYSPEDEQEQLHVYYGLELLEIVSADRQEPAYKMLVGRLHNAGVSLRVLQHTFQSDTKIYVPMGIGCGFQVMTNARAEPSGAQSAANIGIIARNNSEGSQPANLQPFHLGGVGDQDIGTLGLGQFHAPQPNVFPFHPQLPASTSLKLRYMRSGGTGNDWVSKAHTFCES